MNYLAHAYLSFNEPAILTGNIISDFVKGKTKFNYSKGIQKGIHLHRLIDSFTDSHPATAVAKSFFRPVYRLYSGAFVDVVFDHFLACDNGQYVSFGGLENFSLQVYDLLEKDFQVFPTAFQFMFPYMKKYNWLYNYRERDGIEKSFAGLARRAVYLEESALAFEVFNEHYEEFKKCYNQFFPELKNFAADTLSNLMGP